MSGGIFHPALFCYHREKSRGVIGMIMNTNLDYVVKQAIMRAEKLAGEINLYYAYMNHHLDLLNTAIQEKNVAEQEFQKERLKAVRNILMELEYFDMRGE